MRPAAVGQRSGAAAGRRVAPPRSHCRSAPPRVPQDGAGARTVVAAEDVGAGAAGEFGVEGPARGVVPPALVAAAAAVGAAWARGVTAAVPPRAAAAAARAAG
ncbi:hypothetical protein GCM10010286_35590 [Streptomyces toxytricini]|nr:hypothetical protein GCM10010286_35590 [Streptomyces toxytricini]